jgi:hypothetical protein
MLSKQKRMIKIAGKSKQADSLNPHTNATTARVKENLRPPRRIAERQDNDNQ